MEINEILVAIKNLPEEDRQKVLEALTPPTEEAPAQAADATADSQVEETAQAVISDIEQDKATGAPSEQVAQDEKALTDAVATDKKTDAEVKEEAGAAEGEAIPPMTAPAATGTPPPGPASTPQREQAPPVPDDTGAEMPVDYQQIIDGLNAKNLALEAENKQLKAKVEGAFGLSGKPGAFVPVNPLYNDTSDIPRMRK